MTRWIVSVVITMASVSSSFASIAIQPATVHPSQPDSCYNKETKSFYKDGDSWQIGGCAMANCLKILQPSGKPKMMISYEGCGSVGYEPPCYIEEDKTAEYPDCCPQVTCPDSAEEDTIVDDQRKNVTKEQERIIQKPHFETYDVPSSRDRNWRAAIDDLNLQSLDSYDDASSNRVDQNFQKKEEDLFTRNIYPKFFYWF